MVTRISRLKDRWALALGVLLPAVTIMIIAKVALASGVTSYCHYDTVCLQTTLSIDPLKQCPTISSVCFGCGDLPSGSGPCATTFTLYSPDGNCMLMGSLDIAGIMSGCGACPEGAMVAHKIGDNLFWIY
jgi:hypothetical protein